MEEVNYRWQGVRVFRVAVTSFQWNDATALTKQNGKRRTTEEYFTKTRFQNPFPVTAFHRNDVAATL